MQLVEKHIIKSNHSFFNECDNLCFKSKNLYNSMLYYIRQEYILNKSNVINKLHHQFKDSEQYKELPAKVSSFVVLTLQQNFKSFFKSLSDFSKNPKKYKGRPRLPKYLDSIDGRFLVNYTNQAISKKIFRITGKIKLSKTNIEFNTKIDNFDIINCVRIIPRVGYYVIELIYTVPDVVKLPDNGSYMSIDMGINNLATITNNIGVSPIVINGKPLKSINQYSNKKLAYYKSKLELVNGLKTSKRLRKLNLKRINKIDNYLHKSSKIIVDKAIELGLNTIVIGKNDGWKNEVNIGKKSNQNFINIPHSRLIDMITYKCELRGISIILQEESYTSKCSFLDSEDVKKHTDYVGKRVKRGLFKTSLGKFINADVNGSYNILVKAIPNAFVNGIEGVGVHPIVLLIK